VDKCGLPPVVQICTIKFQDDSCSQNNKKLTIAFSSLKFTQLFLKKSFMSS
jgi:hypothetical protein